jgi:hypothetical protein
MEDVRLTLTIPPASKNAVERYILKVVVMRARLVQFGELDVDGKRFTKDVVIEAGQIRKRKKQPSRRYRERYGHTPLSAHEAIPWRGKRLIIGTGAYGKLPIMPEVADEAERRGIEVVALPTDQACRLIDDCPDADVNAILHITC